MPLDQAEATRLQNAKWGKATYSPPALPIRIRLTTSAQPGSAATAGTEVANAGGSAYAAQDASGATPASAVNGVMTSNAPLTYTNMPATTVTGLEEWSSDPRRTTYGSLAAAKTTALGDSLTITTGQLTDTMA